MKKRTVSLIIIIFYLITPTYSQIDRNIWITTNLGFGDILGDFGETNLRKDNMAFGGKIELIKLTKFGLGYGIDLMYISSNNSESKRTYDNVTIHTNAIEFGFLVNYNIFRIFKPESFPLSLTIGSCVNYFSTINSLNSLDSRVINLENYKRNDSGLTISPCISIQYQLNKIRMGLFGNLGFSNSDFYDGYTSLFSSSNDRINIVGLSISYKLR